MKQQHSSPAPLPHQQALIDKFCEAPPNSGHVAYWEPGLGATWTSTLIIKRSLAAHPGGRILVLVPRALAAQMQHQLSSIGVPAQVIDRFCYRAMQDAALSGTALWGCGTVYILGMDFARQEDIAKSLGSVPWSLLLIPEAHQLRGQRKAVVRDLVKSSPELRVLLLTLPGVEEIPRLGIKHWTESTTRLADVVDVNGNRLFPQSQPIVRHFEFALSNPEQGLLGHLNEAAQLLSSTSRNQRLLGSILSASTQSSLSALEEVLRRLRNRLAQGSFDEFAGLKEMEDEVEVDGVGALTQAENGQLAAALDKCLLDLDSLSEDSKLKGFTQLLVDEKTAQKLPSFICILTQYQATLFCVQAALEDLGFAHYVLHGGLPFEERFNAIREFQSNGGILLATAAVMSEGVNLPQVESVVLYDLPQSRLMLQQILGRFQRFGRRGPLTIDVINSRETVQLLTELCELSRPQPKKQVGILAFGSLITDPGSELLPKITGRIKTQTPFGVEYGRISQTRGGAPTLVPHEAGEPVQGEILVLDDTVSVEEARNMLWRRERRIEGSGKSYVEEPGANKVLVREWSDSPGVGHVLYTDFHPEGKIANPQAADLAKRAIQSVKTVKEGMDGISYLKDNLASGIKTKLTADYEAEILKQTDTRSLNEAIAAAKTA
jgi:superfamily II DNA or RNA helicase